MNDWKAQQAARDSAAAALQAAFPGLVPVSVKGGALVAAAKNMRIELKAAFPGVKFSVKSERYSGGDSINVFWADGPNSCQVEAIIERYQGGSFNGMEDIYEYKRNAWRDAFGEAMYVFANRELSDKAIAAAIRTCLATGRIGEGATLEAYHSGALRRIAAYGGIGNESESDVIQRVAYARTWALAKSAPANQPSEVEA